ncbi:MAG: hypothetical protein NTV86_16110 [Planctomycetota bacterium]|nr:hypothetical protein [Planctomycetota bacterium]
MIDLKAGDGGTLSVESVRVGLLPAPQNPDYPGRWVLDLADYAPSLRLRTLDEAVVVQFHDGPRVKLL